MIIRLQVQVSFIYRAHSLPASKNCCNQSAVQ